jgi:hypothetical protein
MDVINDDVKLMSELLVMIWIIIMERMSQTHTASSVLMKVFPIACCGRGQTDKGMVFYRTAQIY